jgi:hypothetical protein
VCKPDSDSNLQAVPTAKHAGAAVMELQMYPPGWNSAISCQTAAKRWCAALTIDSFQGDFAGNINPNCEEPVNFAFLTHDGVPVGPPGPDTQTAQTFTMTPDVLRMNGGDTLLPCFSGPVIPGCTGEDLDFDGYSYHPDWPNGSPKFPTPWYVHSPTTGGTRYSLLRFETDLPRIEATDLGGPCDRLTGTGCTVPPKQAKFYPFVHTATTPLGCAYALSNDLPNQISNFGGMRKAWGHLEFTNYGAGDIKTDNFATRVMQNTC